MDDLLQKLNLADASIQYDEVSFAEKGCALFHAPNCHSNPFIHRKLRVNR